MQRELQGTYVLTTTVGEKAYAFVPSPLPPQPPINWTPELREKFELARIALVRLNCLIEFLPDTQIFLYMYIRKEAVLSSMIEGTQSSLSDLLMYEAEQEPYVPLNDVQEVSSYVSALYHGLELLRSGLPLSQRFFRKVHSVLLNSGRGNTKNPGQFRSSQNWIGGTRPSNATFVPPPPTEVANCLGELENFLNDVQEDTPPILKAALAHVQFETIHPFLDGNGRLGRLLIALILCEQDLLKEPLLYLSLYFKTHRQYYYELLNRVRTTGDWEAWLDFFADAVIVTAGQAEKTALQLKELAADDIEKIRTIGRSAQSVLKVHRVFMERPFTTVSYLVEATGLAKSTVTRTLSKLRELGIIREIVSKKRDKLYSYTEYFTIMDRGIDTPDMECYQ